MVSKPLKKPLNTELLKSVGRGAKEIVVTLAHHPAVLALGIMATSTALKVITEVSIKPGSPERDRRRMAILGELSGLYNGAQGLTVAMAAVPMVTAVAGAVSSVASAAKAPP